MKFKNKVFWIFPLIFLSVGCISNKRVVFMQDLPAGEKLVQMGEMVPSKFEEYLLQYNDVIEINIKTSDPILNSMLDINDTGGTNRNRMMMGGGGGMMSGGDIFYLSGYTLDDRGFVDMPVLGKIELVGMNVETAKAAIEKELKKFVRDEDYFVRVRLGGIRFSALGEFARPGKYTVLQNRVTIFEAIATAGDLTVIAKRDDVMLIRQYPEGSRAHRINLNNNEIMSSEFYFVRPNDMIYAEPMKVRELGTGTTFIQTLQLMSALATLALLLYTTTAR
jgi:polysaccharide biosynthesis/export protein